MEEEHLERLHIVLERFHEFNLKLKPSKCLFIQNEIVYLAHHVSKEGICPSQENVQAVEDFPMPETFMQVSAFRGLTWHYWCFIKGFANIVQLLYDMLGKEVKMEPVQLPPEAQEAVQVLKKKIQMAPVLIFPDFDKSFLLKTDALKEGLGAVLSQKQDYRHYHPVAFGSCSLMPSKKNYHSSKLEFLTLKWSVTEHFKEYLMYAPFVVHIDNNPLTYVLTTPNLDTMGHRWVSMLASFEFTLEYQKGADNGAADALSWVPVCCVRKMVKFLLEGALIGATGRGEPEAGKELLCEHVCLEKEACVKAAKLVPMHVADWGEAQEADAVLAACCWWLKTHKHTLLPKRDVMLKWYLGCHTEMEEGHALFHVWNSLVLNKGVMYIGTMPKGEAEGILAFVVPGKQCQVALNGIHHDTGHQGQQHMLALAQEHFWWPMMVEDCHTLVRGCQQCHAFEGAISKVPLCPIQAHTLLELVHVDFTSVESTMKLNKPPLCQECPHHHRSLHPLCSGHGNQGPDWQDHPENTLQEVYSSVRGACQDPQ